MNCKHVEELLPLYIGSDLEEKRARLVTAHVQSCSGCARSAEEYRDTQQLLQLFEPPPFSEAVYAGMRRRVLHEIERESEQPTLLQVIASLFQPRVMWAASTAVVLAVSVFAFYLIAGRMNEQRSVQQAAESRRGGDTTPLEEQAVARTPAYEPAPSSLLNTGRAAGSGARDTGLVSTVRLSERRKAAAAERAPLATGIAADPSLLIAQASTPGKNPVEQDSSPSDASATSENTLRVEMQTSDPNIRIMWFSQRAKEGSSNDSPKASRR